MQENQQQPQMAQQAACTDEILAAFEEIKFLREQVEFLRELVESQKVYLQHKENQLQELEQELKMTNEELFTALTLDASCPFRGNLRLKNLEHLTLFEAKELAKTILKSETLKNEFVAELLTLIYSEKVKPEELQQTDRLSLQTNPLKKNLAHKKSKDLEKSSQKRIERTQEHIQETRELLEKSKKCLERIKSPSDTED
jgi:spore germination protein YaaH